jgi:hypothetical protein
MLLFVISLKYYNIFIATKLKVLIVSDAGSRLCSGYGILGAFRKLRETTITFVMSVRPSSWNLIFEHFSKVFRENSNFLNIL